MTNIYNESELIRLVDKRIKKNNDNLNTILLATIEKINDDKTINCKLLDIENTLVNSVPFFNVGGSENYINMEIAVGQKCILLVNKYTLESYQTFDYNNSIALIGLSNFDNFENKNIIKISTGLAIVKDSEDLIYLISELGELTNLLGEKLSELASETASITILLDNPSGIGTPTNKDDIALLSSEIDSINDSIKDVRDKIKVFVYGTAINRNS